MTEHRTLYAVVPHLPDAPELSVLNMPTEPPDWETVEWHIDRTGGNYDLPLDLVVGWDADEAAHIEAVTGYGLQLGEPPVYYPTVVRWIDAAGTAQGLLPMGKVAARFHVTGCHPATSTVYGHPTPMLAGCCDLALWARYDDGLWHWTGHAEKVQP